MTQRHFGQADVQEQMRREFARIGVDQEADGLTMRGRPITPDEFLAALAATPDGAGIRGVQATLDALALGERQLGVITFEPPRT